MGINAIDETGITDNDWEVIQVKKAMIQAAEKTVILSISEKLNTHQRLTICGLDEIDTIITELDPSNPVFEPYKKEGITIL